jgi:hypothetical protein
MGCDEVLAPRPWRRVQHAADLNLATTRQEQKVDVHDHEAAGSRPSLPDVEPPPPPGDEVMIPRWVAIASIVVGLAVVIGMAFAGGWAARGPGGGQRAPQAVPTSCTASEILGVVKDWADANERWNTAPPDSQEADQAYDELDAQELRMRATLAKCS